MHICIVRLSALGDIVMCLPLIKTLQKNFPNAKISWVIGKPFHPLLQDLIGVDFIPMPKIKSVSDWLFAKKLLQNYKFDVLLATQASLSANLLYPLISAKRKIGYDSLRSKDFHGLFVNERIAFHKEHTVDGFLRFARAIGATEMCYECKIPLAQEYKSDPYFVINPCSSKRAKDWNYENYLPIIRYVKEKYGLIPILTGGPSDHSVCEQLAKDSSCLNLAGKTSLKELASILKSAQFVVSPDTGPAHIASALGTPVIGLFAPTSSKITGPYFSSSTIIDKHDEVLKRFATAKQKALAWNVRIYDKNAMDLITVGDVIEKIDQII